MLDAADILADREPLFGLFPIKRSVPGLACKPDKIPAGIDKGVERVGLAACRRAARGTVDLAPAGVTVERVARDVEADIFGQDNRQLVAGYADRPAGSAMDHRYRSA